jgi:hypothetical protein
MKTRLILAVLAGLAVAGTTQMASAQPASAPARVTPVYYGGYYGYRPVPPPHYYYHRHWHHWYHSWHRAPRYGYYRYGHPYGYSYRY